MGYGKLSDSNDVRPTASRRQRRWPLRQCTGRDDFRLVQNQGDPSARSWRKAETVEFATLGWVDWFNHRRLLEPIRSTPSAEAECDSMNN